IFFHPVTFFINTQVVCETIYTPLLLAAFGLLLLCFGEESQAKRLKVAFLAGIPLAFLWNTRHETIWIVIFLAVFFLLDWRLQRGPLKGKKAFARAAT